MKRILSLAITFTLLVLLCACEMQKVVVPEQKTEQCTPLLYQVSDENGAVLYLFGSIHATDDRANPLPEYVMDAYTASDYLCVECDVYAATKDIAAQADLTKKFLCEPGKTTADYLDTELYEEAKAFLTEHGIYNALYDYYLPTMWFSLAENVMVSEAGLDAQDGIDMYFLRDAHKNDKEIREVESVEYQYDMMLGFSDELVELLLANSIRNLDESVSSLQALYEAWLHGETAELLGSSAEDTTGMSAEELSLYKEYEDALITERNRLMADKAEEYLAGGDTGFFVVGAAHIVGEGAVADLLSQRGYQVEVVTP